MLPSNLSDPCELGFVSLGKLECKASKWADIRVLYEPLWYISIHSKSAQRPACVLTKYRAEFAKLGFVEVRQRWGEAEESRISRIKTLLVTRIPGLSCAQIYSERNPITALFRMALLGQLSGLI
jgi:hypothetical protein